MSTQKFAWIISILCLSTLVGCKGEEPFLPLDLGGSVEGESGDAEPDATLDGGRDAFVAEVDQAVDSALIVDRGVVDIGLPAVDATEPDARLDQAVPDSAVDVGPDVQLDTMVDAAEPDVGFDQAVPDSAVDVGPIPDIGPFCDGPPEPVMVSECARVSNFLYTSESELWAGCLAALFQRDLDVRPLTTPESDPIVLPTDDDRGEPYGPILYEIDGGMMAFYFQEDHPHQGTIFLQRLDLDGALQGAPIPLVERVLSYKVQPVEQGFALWWENEPPHDFLRYFSTDGEPISDVFMLPLSQTHGVRTAFADGRIAVLRFLSGDARDLLTIDAAGHITPIFAIEGAKGIERLGDDDFVLHSHTINQTQATLHRLSDRLAIPVPAEENIFYDQRGPVMSTTPDGGIVISWADNERDRFFSVQYSPDLQVVATSSWESPFFPSEPLTGWAGLNRLAISWGAGLGPLWVTLALERCNGIDDDCDGEVDEMPELALACATGRPGICTIGRALCGPDGFECTPNDGPNDEICNNLDDDCNGLIDDGINCEPGCGNGRVDPGEFCDDANDNDNDECPNYCGRRFCGNGELDFGEQCDDGNFEDGDGCSGACFSELCGNGQIDFHEPCDDGNLESGDGCDQRCDVEHCGNRVIEYEFFEECDDGNFINGDGCNDTCGLTASYVYQGKIKVESVWDGTVDNFRFTLDAESTLFARTSRCIEENIIQIWSLDADALRDRMVLSDLNPELRCSAVAGTLPAGDYELQVSDLAGEGPSDFQFLLLISVDATIPGDYRGAIGVDDLYTISHAGGPLSLHTSDGMGGCSGDTFLEVFSGGLRQEWVPLAHNDNADDNSPCSALVLDLPAQELVVRVSSIPVGTDVEYVLSVE